MDGNCEYLVSRFLGAGYPPWNHGREMRGNLQEAWNIGQASFLVGIAILCRVASILFWDTESGVCVHRRRSIL
jgi:hypothetical protein